jgi:hypothetical protein
MNLIILNEIIFFTAFKGTLLQEMEWGWTNGPKTKQEQMFVLHYSRMAKKIIAAYFIIHGMSFEFDPVDSIVYSNTN